jgi:O-antigen/teichoic acid export membrane protein
MKRYFAMAVSQASVALLGVALILTVAMLSPTVENFGIAVLIATGALPLLCIFLLWPRARIAGETPRGENTFARDWLVYGFRAFPPLVLAYLAGRGTIFAAHSAIDAGTFGILSVAYQVFEATLAAPQSIAMVMFPRLITGGDISAARLRRECGRIGLISILIALGIVIFFKPILLLMFGHKYDGAYGILLWYLPGFIAYSIVSICIQFFATFHFPWTSNLAWATGAAAGVTASFYGAAWFGARGAAAGASLGWMVAAVGLFLVGIHEIGKRKRLMEPSVGAVAHGR